MYSELIPLSYELSKKGELTLINRSNHNVHVLSIEIWFIAHVERPHVVGERYIKKRYRDVIKVYKDIAPEGSLTIDLGVSLKNIVEIKVHYSFLDRFEVISILAQ